MRRSRDALLWLGLLGAATAGLAALTGVPGSPLLPPLPGGASAPAVLSDAAAASGLDTLDPPGLALRATLLMGIAVVAFLALAVLAWRGLVATRLAVASSLALIAAVTLLPPLLSRDVYSYAIYGRIWAVEGANPYVRPPLDFPDDPFVHLVSGEWIEATSVYGPAFTIVSGGIVRAFGSPPAAVAAFKVLAAGALAASVLIAARLGDRDGRGRGAFAAVAVGLNPALVFHTVGGGHNDVLVGLAVVGAIALLPRRALAATAVLTIGMLVKLVGAVPLALSVGAVFLRAGPGPARRARAILPHVALAVAITAVLLIPFGYSRSVASSFAALIGRLGWASPVRLLARKAQDLGGNVHSIDLAEGLAALVQASFTVLGMILLVLILRGVGRRDPRIGAADAWGWGLLLVSLCAAYLLPWYVAWFVPALALSSRPVPVLAGLAVSALLALTVIPAEPEFDRITWNAAVLVVHYVIAPVMLALLAGLLVDLRTVLLGRRSA